MTCFFCGDPAASFTYQPPDASVLLLLCVNHRYALFKALFWDYWKAGAVDGIIETYKKLGAKALDVPTKPLTNLPISG